MLQLRNIHTYYGDSHVLQGISLHVAPGETIGLLGRNGAGKTTTINTVIGFTLPRAGEIRFKDRDITHTPSYVTAQLGMGLVPQGRRIFPDLTVRENLTIAARRGGAGQGWTLERIWTSFPLLKERESHRGDQLSGGEQQMVAIARALMTNPDLLLLDEPSEGLAPLIVREIQRILSELKEQGLSILLIEQNLSLALELADRVYVMNKGRIVFEGSPEDLRANTQVKQQYLGV